MCNNESTSPINGEIKTCQDITDNRSLEQKEVLQEFQTEALNATTEYFKDNDRGTLILFDKRASTSFLLARNIVSENGAILFFSRNVGSMYEAYKIFRSNTTNNDFLACIVCDRMERIKINDVLIDRLPIFTSFDSRSIIERYQEAERMGLRFVVFATYQSAPIIKGAQFGNGIPFFDFMICDDAHLTIPTIFSSKDNIRDIVGVAFWGNDKHPFLMCHDDNDIGAKKRLYLTATPKIYKSGDIYSIYDREVYGDEIYRFDYDMAKKLNLASDYEVLVIPVLEGKWGEFTNYLERKKQGKLDSDFAYRVFGLYEGITNASLLEYNQEQDKIQKLNWKPSKRVVCYCQSFGRSAELSEYFDELLQYYADKLQIDRHENIKIKHINGFLDYKERYYIPPCFLSDEDKAFCILTNARFLDTKDISIPLDAIVFFDTKRAIIDSIQSIATALNVGKNEDTKRIIIPLILSKNDMENFEFYSTRSQEVENIRNILNAIRSHDSSLNDLANIKKKIKFAVSQDSFFDSKEQISNYFYKKALKEMTQIFYRSLLEEISDAQYLNEFSASLDLIAHKLGKDIDDFFNEKPHILESFRKSFCAGAYNRLEQSDAVNMVCFHILSRPILDAFSATIIADDPIVKTLDVIAEKLFKYKKIDSSFGNLFQIIQEKIKSIKSLEGRKKLIKILIRTLFAKIFSSQSEELNNLPIPQEIVDFILQGTNELLQVHFGLDFNDNEVKIYDPLVGVGCFIARLIEGGFIKDDNLATKINEGIFAQDSRIVPYYLSLINIAQSIDSRDKSNRDFKNIALADSFAYLEDREKTKILPLFKSLSDNKRRQTQIKKEKFRVILSNFYHRKFQCFSSHDSFLELHPNLNEKVSKKFSLPNKYSYNKGLICAIETANSKLENNGILALIVDEGFILSNETINFRKLLAKMFSSIYIVNLGRGGSLKFPKGGQNVFKGRGAVGACLVFMVKERKTPKNSIYYYQAEGWYVAQQKLSLIQTFRSLSNLPFLKLETDAIESGKWGSITRIYDRSIELYNPESKKCIFNKGIFVLNRSNMFYTPQEIGVSNIDGTTFDFGESKNVFMAVSQEEVGCFVGYNESNLHLTDNTLIFPMFLFNEVGKKYSNITDYALEYFQGHYTTDLITKEDIFCYVYALLHHKDFIEGVKQTGTIKNLEITFLPNNFKNLAELGRELMELHINYKNQENHQIIAYKQNQQDIDYFVPSEIKICKEENCIFYNDNITITDIPDDAFLYEICGKSAIEFFIEETNNEIQLRKDNGAIFKSKYHFDLLCKIIKVAEKSADLIKKINSNKILKYNSFKDYKVLFPKKGICKPL